MDDRLIVERFPAGIVQPPPSKSYSHRAIICAAMAALYGDGGDSFLANIGDSEDIAATVDCVAALGAKIRREGADMRVGKGIPGVRLLPCRESGSTLRFLLPIAAMTGEHWVCTGSARLLERPMAVYEDIFAQNGVAFYRDEDGLHIKGALRGGEFALPGDVSSQFISGLLFALPLAGEDSLLRLTSPLESSGYVDMTIETLRRFGIRIKRPKKGVYQIRGGQTYRASDMEIEPDYSQAAFFLGAAALGCDVAIRLPEKSHQGDAAILGVLVAMGAHPLWDGKILRLQAANLRGVLVDAREIPDLIPPIAAICCLCEGESHIVNAGRLRFKESDRLHALAAELARLGADIREEAEGLRIIGKKQLRGGEADAHNDHRIAMALALAGIGCKQPVSISGWQSVNKSYPDFWKDFAKEARHEHLG